MDKDIDCCPKCGGDEGYYTKDYVFGRSHFFAKFDGSEADNGEMYESLKHRPGKRAYCTECHEFLFKMEG